MSAFFSAATPVLSGGFDHFLDWGVDPISGQAFWLRQQHCRRPLGAGAQRIVTAATFQQSTGKIALIQDHEPLSALRDAGWSKRGDWAEAQYNWGSGSFLAESDGQTKARLFTPQGNADWRWKVLNTLSKRPDDASELHWPLNGSRQLPTQFLGDMSVANLAVSGHFFGARLQHWGRLASPGFAMASCQRFINDSDVGFFALGQSLAAHWQRQEALALSVATLRIGEELHHFDRWWPQTMLDGPKLDNYRWIVSLANATHRLEVVVDGGNPRITPWLALNETLPAGGRRVLRVSPFATTHLRLFERVSEQVLRSFKSNHSLLMTALPGQVPSRGADALA